MFIIALKSKRTAGVAVRWIYHGQPHSLLRFSICFFLSAVTHGRESTGVHCFAIVIPQFQEGDTAYGDGRKSVRDDTRA